jgi:hypothetical protein
MPKKKCPFPKRADAGREIFEGGATIMQKPVRKHTKKPTVTPVDIDPPPSDTWTRIAEANRIGFEAGVQSVKCERIDWFFMGVMAVVIAHLVIYFLQRWM